LALLIDIVLMLSRELGFTIVDAGHFRLTNEFARVATSRAG
jgi:hypothetical protein